MRLCNKCIKLEGLGNVSVQLGRSGRWDPEKGNIQGDREANGMCSNRKPWTLMEEV
jgi:hypothetical protein